MSIELLDDAGIAELQIKQSLSMSAAKQGLSDDPSRGTVARVAGFSMAVEALATVRERLDENKDLLPEAVSNQAAESMSRISERLINGRDSLLTAIQNDAGLEPEQARGMERTVEASLHHLGGAGHGRVAAVASIDKDMTLSRLAMSGNATHRHLSGADDKDKSLEQRVKHLGAAADAIHTSRTELKEGSHHLSQVEQRGCRKDIEGREMRVESLAKGLQKEVRSSGLSMTVQRQLTASVTASSKQVSGLGR